MDPRLRYYYNRLVDFEEAKRILAAFERDGVQYVLIESMAMAAQGLIRATRDVDFFVSKTWSREVLVVDGISVRVATPNQLYRMKKDTVRPQDRVDAEAIRERFGLEEQD